MVCVLCAGMPYRSEHKGRTNYYYYYYYAITFEKGEQRLCSPAANPCHWHCTNIVGQIWKINTVSTILWLDPKSVFSKNIFIFFVKFHSFSLVLLTAIIIKYGSSFIVICRIYLTISVPDVLSPALLTVCFVTGNKYGELLGDAHLRLLALFVSGSEPWRPPLGDRPDRQTGTYCSSIRSVRNIILYYLYYTCSTTEDLVSRTIWIHSRTIIYQVTG